MTAQRWGVLSAAALAFIGAVLNTFQLTGVTALTNDALASVNVALAAGAAFIGAFFATPPTKPGI